LMERVVSPAFSADELTQSQRYFDKDYGYSPENPIVTASVQSMGFYLYALRTNDGQRVTWEWQPHRYGDMIEEYQLFVEGVPFKTIYFNPHGSDSEYVPVGLKKDLVAFTAAQKGLTLEEYQKRLAMAEAESKAQAEKQQRTKILIKRCLICIVSLGILCCGGYFGIRDGLPYLKYMTAVRNMDHITSLPRLQMELT